MPESTTDPPDYYAQHSIITDPREHGDLFAGLPTDVPGLVRVVQALLIHPAEGELYDVRFTSTQIEEERLRSVAQMLARIRELDPAPLTVPREPVQRLVGVCRDFAVLFVALLRHQGVPARLRVGFARYFLTDIENEDHWIAEYWDAAQARWVLADPQVDDAQREAHGIDFDTLDMRFGDHFYLAGRAWRLCRSGQAKPNDFGFNKNWKGWWSIRSNLLHDLNALNRIELLPWDVWGDLGRKTERDLTSEDRALLDRLADLTTGADNRLDEIHALYEEMDYSQSVRSRLRLLGLSGDLKIVDAGNLRPSASERLAALQAVRPEHIPDDLPARLLAAPPAPVTTDQGDIVVRGARQHNLKNINVTIPRSRLTVITGVSGSGKSSLAFDTIYAEGRRRYMGSVSAYARRFMEQIEKPEVDHILGLNPTIAIEQKTVSRNPRSTVGTITEVYDYLRVLFAYIGTPHCPQCGRGVQPQTARQIAEQLGLLPPGASFQLLSPDAQIVDQLVIPDGAADEFRKRLIDSVEATLKAGNGLLSVALENGENILLSERNDCPYCDITLPELGPSFFNFNSPSGACPDCNGLGVKLSVDPDLIVTEPHLSLLDGASPWYGNLRKNKPAGNWMRSEALALAGHWDIDLELPWDELPLKFRDAILYGAGDEPIRFAYECGTGRSGEMVRPVQGAIHHINRLFRQTRSGGSRRHYLRFMSERPCSTCQGERLCLQARFVTVGGLRFPAVAGMTVVQAHRWVADLARKLTPVQLEIAGVVLDELNTRLQFMLNVGLHYLTLDRSAPTLSGGEGQRIRLASQLGCGLVGLFYVLDEPSIGLHPRDHHALLDTLTQLRDAGNTILVVEHDADTMRAADWLIDLGPGAGALGGELVAAGTPAEVMANPDSLTGRYLSGELQVTSPNGKKQRKPHGWLTVVGAQMHNLKAIDVRFPLGLLTCVTGVSGSGKSSLVAQTLSPALSRALHGAQSVPGTHERIEGLDQINKVITITQAPIGRTPRSNPGTYVGVFDQIRKVFANTPEAQARGYKAGRFSFNDKEGRCQVCEGLGKKKVEMHFLPDVWVTCHECDGQRFNRHTLEIKYQAKSIAEVLDMDVDEALEFFANVPKIQRIMQTLADVGLGYVKLGQSATTLSGGEAQRVKLAKELARVSTGDTVYILDEPTTGLHFADIQKLLDVLHRLTDAGNTVIVIEHNMDVIKTADWIVDLGPEGGDEGGHIVAQGTPEEVAQKEESYTAKFLRQVL